MGRLHPVSKILFKPFALIGAAIAGKLGQSLFKAAWDRLDSAEPPSPTTEAAPLPKVVGAAALEAATMAGVGAAFERGTARFFQYLFGVWPEKKDASEDE